MQLGIDKNNPPDEWVAEISKRFPCEPEVNRVLTRKMQRRSGPAYQPVSLDALVNSLKKLLSDNIKGSFEIKQPRWLTGGASKIQVSFSLSWDRPGVGHEVTHMVLRMEPAESLVETSRLREFEIVRAFEGIVPVPSCFWIDDEGSYFPYPAIVMSFVEGVTKPKKTTSNTSGMGTFMPPHLREGLGKSFVENLAKIHTRDISGLELTSFAIPESGEQSLEWALNLWGRIWEEDTAEEVPLISLTSAWLRENMPANDQQMILHCDYRVGNFLFNEETLDITAVLDWEMTRIGDFHQDLAWASSPAYGHLSEDGKTRLVGGLLPESEFFAKYENSTGFAVDTRKLYYYQVFIAYIQCVISGATAYRIARNGKTHQDILQCWLLGVVPKHMEDLRLLLERGE